MEQQDRRRFAVILAAGDGKRMGSDRPKVLCEVLFKPMLRWVEDACHAAGIDELYIIAGDQQDLLEQAVSPGCRFFRQPERRGTGHAVMMASEAFAQGGDLLVLNGDAPFVSPQAINAAYAEHLSQGCAVTLMTAKLEDPSGYGRILRGEDGRVLAIVEQKDATPEQLQIKEVNPGAYWFRTEFLRDALPRLTCQNAQGEYYLTDTVGLASADGLRVGGCAALDPDTALGANDRRALQQLNECARRRIIQQHLDNGVDIPFSDGIVIGPEVEIAHDAVILPGTILRGKTRIGAHAVIGPNSYLVDSQVGEGSRINASYLTDSTVGKDSSVGPFSQLRPNSHLGDGVKLGDFVEIKNSTVGDKTSVAHLTYIGDSDVGAYCNFGCGVVTANYDGNQKYRTTIGDRAFIGCNTNLVPPVTVGEGAYTAAGTTIDEDVPAGALAIGRVHQQIKEGWSDEKIAFKKDAKK